MVKKNKVPSHLHGQNIQYDNLVIATVSYTTDLLPFNF